MAEPGSWTFWGWPAIDGDTKNSGRVVTAEGDPLAIG